ncbi:MAG TPA: DNA-3-methyladenine glycosylase 2 family protein [Nocardioidaceae bacterium]|nr:DNA-3-methyladenine glycosylase 2 family protein [Nocardioidaceae bacterium]
MPTVTPPDASRVWRPGFPCDAGATLSALRRGSGDPTYQVDRDGSIWRSARTPEGPVTLHLRTDRRTGEVRGSAWGVGAGWMLDRMPAMLGGGDDPGGFVPLHPPLREAQRRRPGWRVPATGLVLEALVAAALEQKVIGQEAWYGWRCLLRRFGEPAPGPGEQRRMRVLPTPRDLRGIPSWEWLRCRVDPARSRVVVTAARVADSLERTVGAPTAEVERRLRSLPGVGVWTAAEVRQRAHGDADAVSFGDYHVAKNVGWALTGERVDDAALTTLLAPYRPHRYRVQRLLELAGAGAPRRGPRMAPRTHLPG